jgi:hypothetical protein
MGPQVQTDMYNVGFEAFTALRVMIYWFLAPCRLDSRCQCFGETYCFIFRFVLAMLGSRGIYITLLEEGRLWVRTNQEETSSDSYCLHGVDGVNLSR